MKVSKQIVSPEATVKTLTTATLHIAHTNHYAIFLIC